MNHKIIDCQVHCAAPSIDALLPYMKAGYAERVIRTAFQLPPAESHPGGGSSKGYASPAEVAASLGDEVSGVVLVPHQAMSTANWTDTRLCAVYVAALNAYMVDHWLAEDDRFHLAIAVSPHEAELAAAEIERHAGNPRVVAATMPMLAPHLGSPFYRPIIEAAARHNLTLIVHPGGKEGTILGAPALGAIGPRYHGEYECLIWHVAAVNISSIIYDGVFVEFPDLKIAFADFGMDWVGPTMWRLDAEWRALRIDIPWVVEPPSTYLGRNVRIIVGDAEGIPQDALAKLVSLAPATSLLFGSNSPFAKDRKWLDTLPTEVREQLCWRNAADTFRSGIAALAA
ncbi:putative TIM-barrel fold metal-dependent hydrolase [Hephaestia caeni]|uniref:Putative TIM-barrel fold metal-dependent hydrolase n=1 Tax=Hephaestia caeni TaxID=645617 RepID=A0A397P7I3_9SPHN|nr:amidohydrolase family protein [Hephaestia caeni]RIA45500.1 putative TIM-barrel fold metal-dependent hydrolase [Hephaestia caeni]